MISIILVTFNSHRTLPSLLKSILKLNWAEIELIIIDNGSTDNTISIITEAMPELKRKMSLKFIPQNNIGVCSAMNLGVSNASGKYLCLIDHDIEFTPAVLNIISIIQTDSSIGAVQPKVVNAYDTRLIDSLDITKNGSICGHNAAYYKGARAILYPIGACCITRKKTFQEIGGFYDDFFVGFQDVDFGWRLWLTGYTVKAIYEVKIYHSRGTLRKKGNVNLLLGYHGFKNLVLMIIQNMEVKNSLKYSLRLLPLVLYDLLNNPPLGYYELLSLFWIFNHRNTVLGRRRIVQSLRRHSDAELIDMLKYILPKPLTKLIIEDLFKLKTC